VQHNGQWRGICDDSFDSTDAEVACKQLGGELLDFDTGVTGNGQFWLDDLGCTGDEEFLASCSHGGFGNHNCGASEHVTVACLGPQSPTGKLRMDSGFLEVQHNGQWRGICDDSFDSTDAQVACKQLGGELIDFQTGVNGSGQFWLDDLGCSGSEAILASCSHGGFGNHNCGASEHVTVACLGPF